MYICEVGEVGIIFYLFNKFQYYHPNMEQKTIKKLFARFDKTLFYNDRNKSKINLITRQVKKVKY